MNKHLETRNALKKRKPEFQRQDFNIRTTFEGVWRSPKGLHSKQRRNKDSQPPMPSIGYSSPRDVRGLDAKGMKNVIVKNISDLKKIDAKKDNVIISATVGNRSKIKLLEEVKKLGLTVKNLKDIDGFLAKVKQEKVKQKEEGMTKKEARLKAKEEALKKKVEEDKKKTSEEKKEEVTEVKNKTAKKIDGEKKDELSK